MNINNNFVISFTAGYITISLISPWLLMRLKLLNNFGTRWLYQTQAKFMALFALIDFIINLMTNDDLFSICGIAFLITISISWILPFHFKKHLRKGPTK